LQAGKLVTFPVTPPYEELLRPIIGRPDPTFGGRSVITDHIQPLMRSCWVVTVDGTQLTGSLVGHGDRPLAGG
jgi:hypothetical protein